MCIAILNTKKAGRLPKSQIQNSWDNNDMGAGILWHEDNKINVFKSYDYDEYIVKYNELRDNHKVGNIVLHFRIATSGYNGEHNLHPFLVNDNLGFVHNGVISGLGNKEFSDTYEFNDMLKKFKHNFLQCEITKVFIRDYIGSSKLLFLDSDDKYYIINEELGHWKDGNWYSNNSYKQYNNYYYYGNTKVSKKGGVKEKTTEINYKAPLYNYGYNTPIIDSHFDDIDDVNDLDEWTMYEYICDVYGLDPEDEASWGDIEYYMLLNQVDNIKDMYDVIIGEF
jgi:predicted glutamine amidotransferase